ncbi:MAG: DUF3656 domain-containing protein [Veillonellaceae bacterium]|nr:DUF3656 domain-containing protein [Veillonellaceae bacterium]
MVELLAPAGTMENFRAALEAGADAIYLGGQQFNARAHADNFSLDKLEEAVRLAHLCGAAVHVTVNILIGDKELSQLEAYLRDLERIHVDAIIVQDLAVARLAQKVAPHIQLHGSTQMTVTNIGTIRFLAKMGFSRVVLARELSLAEIKELCAQSPIEVEAFIHGALCVCYSGQCLMSSFIGGRSGNRGDCAQPCRLPYELVDETGKVYNANNESYIMSPKDLNYSASLQELMAAGVTSFKIEGRMKKVSYVKQVVGAYRHIIDTQGKVDKRDSKQLQEGFNRGFADAYLQDDVGKTMITGFIPNQRGKHIGTCSIHKGKKVLLVNEELFKGITIKIYTPQGDVVHAKIGSDWQALSGHTYLVPKTEDLPLGEVYVTSLQHESKERLSDWQRRQSLTAYLEGEEGQSVKLTLCLDSGLAVTVTDASYQLRRADKNPTSEALLYKQLGRLGGTTFFLREVIYPKGDYLWPSSVLNHLRQAAVQALEEKIVTAYEEERQTFIEKARREVAKRLANEVNGLGRINEGEQNLYGFKEEKIDTKKSPLLTAHLDEWDQVEAAVVAGVTCIYFGGDHLSRRPYTQDIYHRLVVYCHEHDVTCILVTPRLVRQKDMASYKQILQAMVMAEPDAISIHWYGALEWLAELGYKGPVEGDSSLQIFNREVLQVNRSLGLSLVTLSQELTLPQIWQLNKSHMLPTQAIIDGRTELMVSEYCVINAYAGSGRKRTCKKTCLQQAFYLQDRKGVRFPLKTDAYCRMHILNAKRLSMAAYIPELMRSGLSRLRLDLRQMDVKEVSKRISYYQDILSGKRPVPSKQADQAVTRGHYTKGIC